MEKILIHIFLGAALNPTSTINTQSINSQYAVH